MEPYKQTNPLKQKQDLRNNILSFFKELKQLPEIRCYHKSIQFFGEDFFQELRQAILCHFYQLRFAFVVSPLLLPGNVTCTKAQRPQ